MQIPGSDDEVDLSQIGTDPNFEFDPASRNITVLQDLELATERSTEILIKCEMRTDRSKTVSIGLCKNKIFSLLSIQRSHIHKKP